MSSFSIRIFGSIRNTWLWLAILSQFSPTAVIGAQPVDEINRPYRVFRDQTYKDIGGIVLTADVYRPADELHYPAVLMIHGGGWTFGDKWNLRDHARQVAQAGFVVASVNYRLAPQFPFPAQLEDCRCALRWLHDNHSKWRVRAGQLAVYGYSAGGQLAALLATDHQPGTPKLFAAVCGGTPCEFSFIPQHSRWLAHVLGGTRAENPEAYRRASPIEFVSNDDCPIFLFHGANDLLVPKQSSLTLFDKLQDNGVPSEHVMIECHGHFSTFIHPRPRSAAIRFLKQHLD